MEAPSARLSYVVLASGHYFAEGSRCDQSPNARARLDTSMSDAIRDYRESREVALEDSAGFQSVSLGERWAARIPLHWPIDLGAAWIAIATAAAIARTIAVPQPQNPW